MFASSVLLLIGVLIFSSCYINNFKMLILYFETIISSTPSASEPLLLLPSSDMSTSKESTTGTETQLRDILTSSKNDLERKASRFITTNPSARKKMTESTFSQLECDIPSVAQMIHDQAPLHMVLNLKKPDFNCALTSSGLKTTVDYMWCTTVTPQYDEWNTINRTYEVKFVPDTWKSQPSASGANTSRTIQYPDGLDDNRLPSTDQLSQIFEKNLTNEIDTMRLGHEYDTAARIISNKWEKVCSGVCRSMGATVEGGSEGAGNPLAFFFKPENISLQKLPGNGLSFRGTMNGEAWKVQGDNLISGHPLQSIDWELLASEDEVASHRSTGIS
ncbi:hypothetical protein C361_06930 [Cryptococcus neoformans Tu259-1]|uniref:Uncharacterized protein n=1 Tax=Cryptococcus neoformans Tu259-1 TaxID=1230072 RepID=A0A854Q3Y9_CRYNE|nr:hypothetical protein C361_06930 [Cryptococcus neoformans var. grubii Tu259-1]